VIAYASHCQLDQHGRPVAGYMNICPQMLNSENYDEEKTFWVNVLTLFECLDGWIGGKKYVILCKLTLVFYIVSVLSDEAQCEITLIKTECSSSSDVSY